LSAPSSSPWGVSRSKRTSKHFLSLDLPGTKVVIGTGPEEAALKRRFPQAKFLGLLENGVLAAHLAAADVFVFPSRTDTFGVVQLEALASGVPVAAFPVTGPKDVVGGNPVGVFARKPGRGLHRGASNFSHGVSDVRAGAVLGKQRASIHRAYSESGRATDYRESDAGMAMAATVRG